MKYLLIILLLSGCGVEDESSGYPGWSGKIVEQNEKFTLAYDTAVIKGPLMEEIEQVWLDVQTCIGVPMPDPMLIIEYTPLATLPIDKKTGDQLIGYITYNARYIRIFDGDPLFYNNTLRHELVHWIEKQLGVSKYDLDNHTSQFYLDCTFKHK